MADGVLGRHVGFHREAPDTVVWSEGTFIRPVHPSEVISINTVYGLCVLVMLGMFILPGAAFLIFEDYFKESGTGGGILFGLFILGFLLMLFHTLVIKRILFRRVQGRAELLFVPDRDCIAVGIEDALTYDKRKLTADDFGILKITPEAVFLEMCRYRARFAAGDLSVSLLYTASNTAGVRLTCDRGGYLWSVVLAPMGSASLNPVGQSKKLLRQFNEAGYDQYSGLPEAAADDDDEWQSAGEREECAGREDALPAAPAVIEEMEEHDDVAEERYRQIAEAIEKQKKSKSSLFKTLGLLVLSLVLFFQLGLLRWGAEAVGIILLVVFVHEAGHFAAMKFYGYRNIKMFFIPLIGAAVAGHEKNVASWKKAMVMLAGPVPGIWISILLFAVYFFYRQEMILKIGLMFLGLNVLNLLPIFPLDGGQFLNEVLFCRNRFVELIMHALAALSFLVFGFVTKSWFFKILGFINLAGLSYKYKLTKMAHQLKKDLETRRPELEEMIEQAGEEDVPRPILKRIIGWIYENMPGPTKPKVAATTALEIWKRVRVHPPRAGATILLLVLFFGSYVVSLVSFGLFSMAYVMNANRSEIVVYEDEGGVQRYKEQVYFMGALDAETELSDDQQYYHGWHTDYYGDGSIYKAGAWDMGVRHGTWQWFDPNGMEQEVIVYEQGLPMVTRIYYEQNWVETRWEEYDPDDQDYYREEAAVRHGPSENRFPFLPVP